MSSQRVGHVAWLRDNLNVRQPADYRAITTAVRKFQFVQRSLDEIELKLVLSEPMNAGQEARMKALVQRNLGRHFGVTLTCLDDIPPSGRGKYEEFISLVQA